MRVLNFELYVYKLRMVNIEEVGILYSSEGRKGE